MNKRIKTTKKEQTKASKCMAVFLLNFSLFDIIWYERNQNPSLEKPKARGKRVKI